MSGALHLLGLSGGVTNLAIYHRACSKLACTSRERLHAWKSFVAAETAVEAVSVAREQGGGKEQPLNKPFPNTNSSQTHVQTAPRDAQDWGTQLQLSKLGNV